MGALDLIILGVCVVGFVIGCFKGFFKQLASLAGLVVGLFVARLLYAQLAEKLCHTLTDSMTVAQVVAFIAIWVAVPLLFTLAAALLSKAMEVIKLGWINRLFGGLLGLAKYVLLVGLFICVIEFIDSHNILISKQFKESSLFYYPVKDTATLLFHMVTNA